MKQENKTKSVKKFSVKMFLAMVFGGVLGGLFGIFMYYAQESQLVTASNNTEA